MPDIKVPKITIPTVDIPSVPYFTQNVLTGIKPACDLIDRDLEITQNPTIVFHNRKQYATCPEVFVQENTETGTPRKTATKPLKKNYQPIIYDPEDTIEAESSSEYEGKLKLGNFNLGAINKKEKSEEELPPCPDLSRVLPVGSFTTDLRTERIVKYVRSEANNYDCIPILEEVSFISSVLPSAPTALNIVTISLLATAGPAFLLPVIKSVSKTAFKKIFAKFNKSKKD